jgi:hypothetical protein
MARQARPRAAASEVRATTGARVGQSRPRSAKPLGLAPKRDDRRALILDEGGCGFDGLEHRHAALLDELDGDHAPKPGLSPLGYRPRAHHRLHGPILREDEAACQRRETLVHEVILPARVDV